MRLNDPRVSSWIVVTMMFGAVHAAIAGRDRFHGAVYFAHALGGCREPNNSTICNLGIGFFGDVRIIHLAICAIDDQVMRSGLLVTQPLGDHPALDRLNIRARHAENGQFSVSAIKAVGS